MNRQGPLQLLDFLQTKKAGDLVTASEILRAVPAWKEITLKTYRKKNKLGPFLAATSTRDTFRVVRDGSTITEADINAALTQVSARTVTLARGDQLVGAKDVYTLKREKGIGAVGAVWEATTSSGAHVAVKVCSPRADLLQPAVLPNVFDRFRREARLSPRVANDAIIMYLDAGDHVSTSFLVMELAVCSLRDELVSLGKLAVPAVAMVGRRVSSGLRWLHNQNCVHRDIKPPNILRTPRGHVLGDLGIVRWGELNPAFTNAGTITKASVQLGSFHYMAPEQLDDPHSATSASDVYAFGVTLYELLTGDAPTPHRVAAAQLGSPFDSAELNSLILRMTNYLPDGRPSLDEIDFVLARLAPARAASF